MSEFTIDVAMVLYWSKRNATNLPMRLQNYRLDTILYRQSHTGQKVLARSQFES